MKRVTKKLAITKTTTPKIQKRKFEYTLNAAPDKLIFGVEMSAELIQTLSHTIDVCTTMRSAPTKTPVSAAFSKVKAVRVTGDWIELIFKAEVAKMPTIAARVQGFVHNRIKFSNKGYEWSSLIIGTNGEPRIVIGPRSKTYGIGKRVFGGVHAHKGRININLK